jgi:hypothetical protein
LKPLKYIIIFFAVAFMLLQFYSPNYNTSDIKSSSHIENSTSINDTLQKFLSNTCYDCHSNNTNYPTYAKISPISWYINQHIEDGKKALNFSHWQTYSDSTKRDKIQKSIDLIKRRWMPMPEYALRHKNAMLSNSDIELFVNQLEKLKINLQ